MTDDERFERDLAAVVREAAPDVAPVALRRRVDAAMSRPPTPSSARRWSPLFGAAAAAAVLLAVALIGPRLVQAPGRSAGSTGVMTGQASPGASVSQTATRPATANPSTVALPEPVAHPGNLQVGSLLTPDDGYAVNTDGRLLVTRSAGAAWRDVTPSDTVTEQLAPFFLDPTNGWASGFDHDGAPGLHVWRTTDAGATWRHGVVAGLRDGNWSLVFLTPMIGWLANDPGGARPQPELRWTKDGGATWSDPIDLAAATGIATLETLTFVDEQVGFLSGNGLFRRTSDGGRTWSEVDLAPQVVPIRPDPPTFQFGSPSFFDREHGLVEVGVHQHDPERTLLSTSIFTTDDGGASWQLSRNDSLHRSWMFIDAEDWVALDGDHVSTTTDGGETITVSASTGLPLPFGRADGSFVDPLHGWVSAAAGCPPGIYCSLLVSQLYETSDGGRTWGPVGDCDAKGGLFPCSPAPS